MGQKNHDTDCSETHPACRALRLDSKRLGVVEEDNLPFMLCPAGAETAALLVHGFTATPWEMRLLAEHLADRGIASLAVRLPGHGTSPEDLAQRHWQEWLGTALDGYRLLDEEFASVFGIGMSTGCLVLLAAAAKNPLNGLILCSPYLRVLHKLAPYAGWLRWLRPYHEKAEEKDPQHHYYLRRPVAGVHQINSMIKAVRKELPQITCPVLAFNGEGDQTVDISSGRELVRMMGSTTKHYQQYGPDVPHVLTREENPRRKDMFNRIVDFIQELNER